MDICIYKHIYTYIIDACNNKIYVYTHIYKHIYAYIEMYVITKKEAGN